MIKATIVWFNKDLRLKDHLALNASIADGQNIIPLYIYDPSIKTIGGAQKWWLHNSLQALDRDLKQLGSRLILRKGRAADVFKSLISEVEVQAIHWHRPYAVDLMKQSEEVVQFCSDYQIQSKTHKGNLLIEPNQVQTLKGGSFSVYTPFWNVVHKLMIDRPLPQPKALPSCPDIQSDLLEDWNLIEPWSHKLDGIWRVGEQAAQDKLSEFLDGPIEHYDVMRDIPGKKGTSELSPYLHFGEISPRDIWHQVLLKRELSHTGMTNGYTIYLKEIVWREFSAHLLYHNPTIISQNFRREFDGFPWSQDHDLLNAWQRGLTGYPIIDAGMRQLWATGTMHNRVRMIVASFLTKNLMIDWRLGEAWFWETLLDADQASNAANWQWVAGCGADAAPYFRIFNPVLQSQKFDAKGDYIRTWVPELKQLSDQAIHTPFELSPHVLAHAGITLGQNYPKPLVDLKATRDRALKAYKEWVKSE